MNQNALTLQSPQEELALWLAKNQPQVFKSVLRTLAQDEARRRGTGMAGISDWLSGIGSTLGGAVKSVGSFITSPTGLATLTAAGGLYLQTQAQKDALKVQVANARAGYSPAPIQTIGTTPQTQLPVYTDPATGIQYPFTSQLSSQLMPQKTFRDYLPWIGLGIGGVALVYFLTRS